MPVESDIYSDLKLVAPGDARFGLSRMYRGFSHLPEGSLKVFRDLGNALEWLGLDRDAA